MALWPNGRLLTQSPYRFFGPGAGLEVYMRGMSDRLCRYVNANYLRTASTPDGYGMVAYVPPVTAGSMSTLTQFVTFEGTGYLLQGGPVSGTGTITVSGEGNMSLIVAMSGTAPMVTFAGTANLSLIVGLAGTGSIVVTGLGSLSLIVPFDGVGSITFVGSGDLRGKLSLSGSWTPYTELSPENLARAVWSSSLPSNFTGDEAGRILYTLMALIRNKKRLVKEGGTWYLVIRNDNDTGDLIKKALKDVNGNNISDIEAGVLAQELPSIV